MRDLSPMKLLDRVREALRVRQYSLHTEEAYVRWSYASSSSTISAIPKPWMSLKLKRFLPTWL